MLLLKEQDIYQSPAVHDYLAKLDLSEGQALSQTILAICPYYGEIFANRKFAVLQMCRALSRQNALPEQVIIAGAGLDATGLELACLRPGCQIFEIDQGGMETKAALITDPNCHFITADLKNPQHCRQQLQQHAWQKNQPSLLLLEGISYYITTQDLGNLCQCLVPQAIVVDYLKPEHTLSDPEKQISYQVFSAFIGNQTRHTVTRYDVNKLSAVTQYSIVQTQSMYELERLRCQKNCFFTKKHDGWIEVSLLKRMEE